MPIEDRVAKLEGDLKKLTVQLGAVTRIGNALEGRPSDATLSLPHNDSWLFEDNVDGTHPANLRYVIASNTQKIISARLTMHFAPYRTYNSLTLSSTGTESRGHTHASAAHGHSHQHNMAIGSGGASGTINMVNPNGPLQLSSGGPLTDTQTILTGGIITTPADTGGESLTHTHSVSGSATLGVTEGATATGVSVLFDGVDQTAALGGPFNADVIELDVRPYIATSLGVIHVLAMQPTGLGRIEAHLRLGVFVSAGQVI